MQAVLWLWPAMYRSIYGRFLLLQLDSSSSVAILGVLLSILSVASRLCSRKARTVWSFGSPGLVQKNHVFPHDHLRDRAVKASSVNAC